MSADTVTGKAPTVRKRRPSVRDIRTGEELVAGGWKPVQKGSEILAEPGDEKKGRPRRLIHIPGLAP